MPLACPRCPAQMSRVPETEREKVCDNLVGLMMTMMGMSAPKEFHPKEIPAHVPLGTSREKSPEVREKIAASATMSGKVICSIMGTLVLQALSYHIVEEKATTRVIQTVTPPTTSNCTGTVQKTCDINVKEWCTPATTPPDYQPSKVRDMVSPFEFEAWDDTALCARVVWNGGHSAWACSPGIGLEVAAEGAPNPPQLACTYNS
jgi:hypothetical protein